MQLSVQVNLRHEIGRFGVMVMVCSQADAGALRRFFAPRRRRLALAASLSFLASTLFFFLIYGHEFLQVEEETT